MRNTFVNTLVELAKKDRDIELVTGDLGFGVLKPFWEQLPDQFINAGIAEQNMTTVAAGMALEGKTVFTYSIGNFPTLRCLEQIRNDCAYHGANVKIVCVGGGFDLIVTVEEHNTVGGFGGAVAEVLAELPSPRARLLRIGLHDVYSKLVGSQEYLRSRYGLDAAGIAAQVLAEAQK